MIMKIYLISLLSLFIADCNQTKEVILPEMKVKYVDLQNDKYEKSVFASGCFWCVEAVYESVEGVAEAISGYAGGTAESANYSDVSAGTTDHAEAVEVYYNPEVVSYNTLLEVFFGSHDPTTLNRQGPDAGTQYRSTIFYKNDEEKMAAEAYIAKLKEEKAFDGPITTTLEPLTMF
jgi:peptide-methionine (S)-S-oxide reductase